MKLNQLFKYVFDDTLKANGFKKFGLLYARVYDEILQGVYLDPINPPRVLINLIPLARVLLDGGTLDKGYWIQDCGAGIDSDLWYQKENNSENEADMRKMLQCFLDHALPLLNQINTFDKYLEEVCSDDNSQTREYNFYKHFKIHEYDLIYIAYKDRSFERAKTIYDSHISEVKSSTLSDKPSVRYENEEERNSAIEFLEFEFGSTKAQLDKMDPRDVASFQRIYQKELDKIMNPSREKDLQEVEKEIEDYINRFYKNFKSLLDNNDIESASQIIEESLNKSKERILSELKIIC